MKNVLLFLFVLFFSACRGPISSKPLLPYYSEKKVVSYEYLCLERILKVEYARMADDDTVTIALPDGSKRVLSRQATEKIEFADEEYRWFVDEKKSSFLLKRNEDLIYQRCYPTSNTPIHESSPMITH